MPGRIRLWRYPPCDRWSRMAPMHGNVGEDGGKFVCALDAVRHFGGDLEDPYGSHRVDCVRPHSIHLHGRGLAIRRMAWRVDVPRRAGQLRP